MNVVKAAAVQLSPLLYSREGTVEKVVRKIHELGQQGVQFATFPETVVPNYPSLNLISVILTNPVMIDAYLAGVTGNSKPFPDGSKMAKIHWKPKKSADAPGPTTVPGTLHDVDFIARDSKRFADTGNWGWAEFDYDAASDTFTPLGSGANCGYACHTIVKGKDYVFTAYPKR